MAKLCEDWYQEQMKKQEREQAEAWKKQKEYEETLSTAKRPTTDKEKRAIMRLAHCSFLPGSWDKRFIKSLYKLADPPIKGIVAVDEISEKQSYWINHMIHRYHKQLGLSAGESRDWLGRKDKW